MNSEMLGSKSKEQFRVVINREANDALETFVSKLTGADDSTKITKSELANYLFCRIEKFFGATEVAEVRAIFFDAKRALEVILSGANSDDDLPEDLRNALLKHYGIRAVSKEKRPKEL